MIPTVYSPRFLIAVDPQNLLHGFLFVVDPQNLAVDPQNLTVRINESSDPL